MARRGLLLLLLLLSALQPLWPSALPPPGTAAGKAAIASLILSALERATVFLEKRLPEINLDGVVGFRVLAVQLKGVQEEWAQDPPLQPLSLRAGKLVEKLEALLPRSLRYLQLSHPQYLREFRPAVQPGFWKLPHTWTRTNASLVYSTWEPQDLFSEGSSDRCLVQLLGTGMDGAPPCRLSDPCRTLMTRPGCSGYCLSHQMLFFLWARMMGCTDGPFHHSQQYLNVLCANMMDVNRRIEAIGYTFPTQDLFLENIMFCGLAGFSDFYKRRWLEAIVSWQRLQEGCFGKPAATGEAAPRAPQSPRRLLRRVKRQEKEFTDGCLAHQTTTAVAALGGFLYILAEDPGGRWSPATPSST
uniref:Chromosome 16 open reading frame 89 n=1 Tax=Oryctolagus cuniculus TaxID=9986 RepID=G1T0A6_RABIT